MEEEEQDLLIPEEATYEDKVRIIKGATGDQTERFLLNLLDKKESKNKEEGEPKAADDRPPPRTEGPGQTNRKNENRSRKDEQPKSKRRATGLTNRRAKPQVPKPNMLMFTVNNRTYFRDANYGDKNHFVRADQKVQYDREAMAQKIRLSKTSRRVTGEKIMEAEARDRQLRGNTYSKIVKPRAEEHVESHLASMYRTKVHETSALVVKLVAEREG
jgi:hypothetical protein